MERGYDRLPAGDQGYFLKGWQTYCKVREYGYIFHQDVYGALRRVLVDDAPRPFRLMDVGCGDSVPTAAALFGTEVGGYVGIDMSRALLDLARVELARVGCPVIFVEGDYRTVLADWREHVDVVWIGQSLHHMDSDEKLPVMRQVRRIVDSGGLFLIWEPTSLPDEGRIGWQTRVDDYVATWTDLDEDERRTVIEHGWASDHPETVARWLELGREAGFAAGELLLEAPPRLGAVYKFRA
jgi:SAM-dependent methyltransferase